MRNAPWCRRLWSRSRQEPFSCRRPATHGAAVQRVKFRRAYAAAVLRTRGKRADRHGGMSRVAMAGSQAQRDGPQVRIVPAQFVKPYVKSQKNDTIDAEAIAEAVTRPTMRFVEVEPPSRSTCRHSTASATSSSQIGRG